ncbi:MAG TPA: tetratricopeptide repeat protein [Phycisphaerae bacterium]|nr:tetratricopeptide repeat protein [Phycisphaerae bacterium]
MMPKYTKWAVLAVLAIGTRAEAAPPKVAEQVQAGNAAYADGKYEAALKAYDEAEVSCPDCPQIAYNRGLAYYQMRDFIKAREQFNTALATKDLHLEEQAKYNLGNVAYSQALEKLNAPKEAIELARQAIYHYRDALDLDAQDADARGNIEIAQLFIKDMLDKQKKQQEQQQQQKQDQQNKQDQQKQDEQKQDQQDQQRQDQQSQDQQQQDQQQQDQQQQQDKQQGEKDEGDKQQQQQSGEQSDEQQEQQQQQEAEAQQQQAQEQEAKEQEGQAVPLDPSKMTDEEVDRILQAVRDREAQRREEKARRMNARRAPVTRDW